MRRKVGRTFVEKDLFDMSEWNDYKLGIISKNSLNNQSLIVDESSFGLKI